MKIQCDFCGNTYEDTLKECPDCGAPNQSHYDGDVRPRTIAELKSWYQARQLPPENVTRFFIGKDVREPKAFGIYQDANGDFIVYKNKADGTRAVRYQGDDEQYAVHELYQKLKDEIVHQKSLNSNRGFDSDAAYRNSPEYRAEMAAYRAEMNKQSARSFRRTVIGALIVAIAIIFIMNRSYGGFLTTYKYDGYYTYDDDIYYKSNDYWYSYDKGYDSWYRTEEPSQFDKKNTDPYFMGKNYSDAKAWEYSDSQFSDVKQSTAFQDDNKASSSSDSYNWDNDSDYDWDGGSDWDSDSTDWDSDW